LASADGHIHFHPLSKPSTKSIVVSISWIYRDGR